MIKADPELMAHMTKDDKLEYLRKRDIFRYLLVLFVIIEIGIFYFQVPLHQVINYLNLTIVDYRTIINILAIAVFIVIGTPIYFLFTRTQEILEQVYYQMQEKHPEFDKNEWADNTHKVDLTERKRA